MTKQTRGSKKHDALAKSFLTNLEVARDFLRAYLPESLKERCDFNTLKIEPSSFVEEELRQHVSDVLYSLNIAGEEGLIYCVVEAQSTPDRLMPLRLLRYVVSALKKYAEEHKGKKLPVIIPILFYTGSKSPYPYSVNLYDCFSNPDLAKKTFLDVKLVDISVIPDEEIKTHGHIGFLELVSKHIRDRDILKLAYEIVDLLKDHHLARELYENMLHYLVRSGESAEYKIFIQALIEGTTGEYKENAMTIAEQLKQEGKQIGYQEGIHAGMQQGEHEAKLIVARNMLAEGTDIHFIKKVTGLTEQELIKLQNNIH